MYLQMFCQITSTNKINDTNNFVLSLRVLKYTLFTHEKKKTSKITTDR